MAVFLKLESDGRVITEIGPGGLLHSLFSTIAARLENNHWGTNFLVVMGPLYQGVALPQDVAAKALKEWREIRKALADLPPSTVVGDIEQPNAPPPWGDNVGPHVTSVANYYVTKNGLNLVTEIDENLKCVVESGGTVQFVSAPSIAHVG